MAAGKSAFPPKGLAVDWIVVVHHDFKVVDGSREEWLSTKGASCGLDCSCPHTSCLLTFNHNFSLFFSIAVAVHHGVVGDHLEESIIHCYSSIKFSIQFHLVAVGSVKDLLQIINFQLNFSSFQWLSSILVLETHVDTKKVKCFVHLANKGLSFHPVQGSSLACCSYG